MLPEPPLPAPVEAPGVALEVLLWLKLGGVGNTFGLDGLGVALGVVLGVLVGLELVVAGVVAILLPPCELEPTVELEKLAPRTLLPLLAAPLFALPPTPAPLADELAEGLALEVSFEPEPFAASPAALAWSADFGFAGVKSWLLTNRLPPRARALAT